MKAGKRRPRWWWLPWVVIGRLKFGRVTDEQFRVTIETKWRRQLPGDGVNDIWGLFVFDWKSRRWNRWTLGWQYGHQEGHINLYMYSKVDGATGCKPYGTMSLTHSLRRLDTIKYERTSWLNFRFHARMDTHEARHSDTVVTIKKL